MSRQQRDRKRLSDDSLPTTPNPPPSPEKKREREKKVKILERILIIIAI